MTIFFKYLFKIIWVITKYTLLMLLYTLMAFCKIAYFMMGGDTNPQDNSDTNHNKWVPVFDNKGQAHLARYGSPESYHGL